MNILTRGAIKNIQSGNSWFRPKKIEYTKIASLYVVTNEDLQQSITDDHVLIDDLIRIFGMALFIHGDRAFFAPLVFDDYGNTEYLYSSRDLKVTPAEQIAQWTGEGVAL